MNRTLIATLFVSIAFAATSGEADPAAAGAAKKAADYLLKSQNADGSFGKSKQASMPGVTALVLEALAGSPDKLTEANPAVAKAVQYLLSKQQPSGAIAIPEQGLENYNTAVAIIALKQLNNPAHKDAIEKAKAYILSTQINDEKDPSFGAFSYGSAKRGDLSNTAFSIEALKAAGLEAGSPAYKNALTFIRRCQDNEETNDSAAMKGGENSGGFVYSPGESPFGTSPTGARPSSTRPRPYGNMTYEAVKSLVYAGVKKDDPVMKAAFRWISKNYSVKEHPGAVGNEGYYYYVEAFAKAMASAGVSELELADGRKATWSGDLGAHLASTQRPDGSWVNSNGRWMEDEPVLSTAYALQALNLALQAQTK